MPWRVKCGSTEEDIVVAHGCRKRKKLICGPSAIARSFLEYVENTWVGKKLRGRMVKTPICPIEMWNKNAVILREEYILTNNAVEVIISDLSLLSQTWFYFYVSFSIVIYWNCMFQNWNSQWKRSLPRKPKIWDVIEGFLVEDRNSRVRLAEVKSKTDLYIEGSQVLAKHVS